MSDSPVIDTQEPVSFEAVLETELDIIRRQRSVGDQPAGDKPPQNSPGIEDQARAMHLAGLAFSGGGIRSATFNLGFIQGLANHKALHLFDYLSTVSGGGYIGGWFSAFWQRLRDCPANEDEIREAQQVLATPPDAAAKDGPSAFPRPEATAVRFVRRYANYLTLRLGMSGDTLALIATAVRNFAVMQLVLVSLIITGFASMLWLLGSARNLPQTAPALLLPLRDPLVDLLDLALPGRWLMLPAIGLMFVALAVSLRSQSARRGQLGTAAPNLVILVGLLAAMISGVLIAVAIVQAAKSMTPMEGGLWLLVPGLGYCLAWSSTLMKSGRDFLRAIAGMAGGAAVFAGALYLSVSVLTSLVVHATLDNAVPLAVAFAPVVAIATYSLIISVHLGLAGGVMSEWQREWWSRAGGQAWAMSIVWALAWVVLLYAPPLMQMGAHWSVAGGGLWAALTWAGSHFASGKDTGTNGIPWKEVAAIVAPWLFVAGLLGLLAWIFVVLLPGVMLPAAGQSELAANLTAYQGSLGALDPGASGQIALAVGILFAALVALVDLNLFSAHSFYASRLGRSFLGASRKERHPNAFTGFDAGDDMKLSALKDQRPIHLFNANLNLTGGQELAWQTRRGASFVFTPQHCGYSAQTSMGKAIGGYRPTDEYAAGELTVATAVAACGAAASPNMGFHTSSSVAALLTIFNLRLARWCPNPTRNQWMRREPRYWSAGPLFAELSGETDDRSRWLNISDGGHFENLGLYELIRRRAALIVVTDVSADPGYQFDDLAMAVRKISVDLGVRLEIDAQALDDIRPQGDKGTPALSQKAWALGRIIYPDSNDRGYLIYVKSALRKDAPVDIRQYRDAHPSFPHETTADQWFDEDQFEAYRHLGQGIAEDLCRTLFAGNANAPARERIVQICETVRVTLDQGGHPHG